MLKFSKTENPKNMQSSIAKKVDVPFLVCAALGAANCIGWEINWMSKDEKNYSVLICADGSWKSSWNYENIPEVNDPVDVKIFHMNSCKDYFEKWEEKKYHL